MAKRRSPQKIIVRRCIQCNSSAIAFDAGIITGQYHCKKCGFISPFVIEEETSVNTSRAR